MRIEAVYIVFALLSNLFCSAKLASVSWCSNEHNRRILPEQLSAQPDRQSAFGPPKGFALSPPVPLPGFRHLPGFQGGLKALSRYPTKNAPALPGQGRFLLSKSTTIIQTPLRPTAQAAFKPPPVEQTDRRKSKTTTQYSGKETIAAITPHGAASFLEALP